MRTRRFDAERGATAVEFALVLPFLLALVGMLFTAALGLGVRGLLLRGAEAGARSGAVIVQVTTGPERYRSDAEITQAVRDATILLDATEVTIGWLDAHRGEGARFTVTATYTWSNPAARLVGPLVGAAATDAETFVFQAQSSRVRE